jgi:single-stranded DNA-specific DHH superfamily exonuclease
VSIQTRALSRERRLELMSRTMINKAIEKINSTQRLIQVVSDLDCDGVAAASILASALIQTNKSFQITFVTRVSDELIESCRLALISSGFPYPSPEGVHACYKGDERQCLLRP